MELKEEFYFEPSSKNGDTECYIWITSVNEIKEMSQNGHEELFKNHKPISELKQYMIDNPKHKIHSSVFEEFGEEEEKLKDYFEKNNIKIS